MAGIDTAVFNGQTYETKIKTLITSKINLCSEYSLKEQYSYTFGFSDCNKRGYQKIDFCITKNSIPWIFIECKNQNVGGSASDKCHATLNNFRKCVKDVPGLNCCLVVETNNDYPGIKSSKKMIEEYYEDYKNVSMFINDDNSFTNYIERMISNASC